MSKSPAIKMPYLVTPRNPHGVGSIYGMENQGRAGGRKKAPTGLIKCGLTNNIDRRLKEARKGTSTYQLNGYNLTPENFRYMFTMEVSDMKAAEDMMFKLLAKYRVRSDKEFFKNVPKEEFENMLQKVKHKYGVIYIE